MSCLATNGLEYSLGALEIRKIGVDKFNPPSFIKEVCDLMGFNDEVKEHMLQYTGFHHKKVDLLIGLKSSALLGRRIPVEQLGGIHSPMLPNISIMKTILSPNLIVTGSPGIDKKLTKPTLLIHKNAIDEPEMQINNIRVDLWESSDDDECDRLVIDLEQGKDNEQNEVGLLEQYNDTMKTQHKGSNDCAEVFEEETPEIENPCKESRDEARSRERTLCIEINKKYSNTHQYKEMEKIILDKFSSLFQFET